MFSQYCEITLNFDKFCIFLLVLDFELYLYNFQLITLDFFLYLAVIQKNYHVDTSLL